MYVEPENSNTLELAENLEQSIPSLFSSIDIQTSSMANEDIITENKGKKHYICGDCKSLHLIKIDKHQKIKIECRKKGQMKLGDFLSNKILNSENLDTFKKCPFHEIEKIGFCPTCKKDLCVKCQVVKDCEYNQMHKFISFKKKNEEISKKEEFILYALKKKNQKSITENSNTSEKLSEENQYIKVEGNENEIKISKIKGVTECLEELDDLRQFIDTLINSKDNIPSYINYENIIILYHFFCDKLNLYYYSYSNNQTRIRLFGEIFIKNNINKCSVMIDNEIKKIEDCEFYELEDIDKEFNITLFKEDDIIDMSYMFNDCEVLQLISEDSKWSTNNVVNMSYMFCNCKALTTLPEFISKWDTSKVTNMSNMFNGCDSLKEIKGISKWNTSKVENMSNMFYECNFLENLENIMKWDTKNVIDMSYMFYNCLSLKSIGIDNQGKWNTEKVEKMSYMFYGCESLERLPDSIASWNTSKVIYMMFMFSNCKSLKYLPNISNWKTKNVSYMNNMFQNCSSLESLPEITKWNFDSLIDINYIFKGCKSLKASPDFSNWNKIKFKKGILS